MPVFIGLVLILSLWIAYEKKKNDKISEKKSKDFWDKETDANMVRKKDISTLPYIVIPYEKLPFKESGDDTVNNACIALKALEGQRIINLSAYTNTDLKLMYGTANLPILSEYDHNFTALVRNLAVWGRSLYESGEFDDAVTVLEFAVSAGSDVRDTYLTLARIYARRDELAKLDSLIVNAEAFNPLVKDALINNLKDIKASAIIGEYRS